MIGIDLNGKTASVGGSTQGIGWATAQRFAEAGARVILIARNEEALKDRIADLSKINNQDHQMVVCDMMNRDSVLAASEQLKSLKPDIHVNNTGGPKAGPAHTAGVDEYEAAFQLHLVANQLFVQGIVDHMKEQNSGRIINVISTSVKVPLNGLGVSNTIRGAVGNWSKTLANELGGFQITVNNVLPGATSTERLSSIIEGKSARLNQSIETSTQQMLSQVPMKRFAKPQEIANAITFLASDLAAYINGTNVVVDGGRTACL